MKHKPKLNSYEEMYIYQLNSLIKISIIFLSSLFLLSSCEMKKANLNSSEIKKDLTRKSEIKEDNDFIIAYDSIEKSKVKSFEELTDNFFNSKEPDIRYYALFCSFCIHNKEDESLSEEYSLKTFELFKNNKIKSEKLIKNIYKLNKNDRDAILASIIRLMCLDLGDNEYNLEKFNTDFTTLSKNSKVQETVKKCLDDVVL